MASKHLASRCKLCGVGEIFTGTRSHLNGRVDGKIACIDCVVADIKQTVVAKLKLAREA